MVWFRVGVVIECDMAVEARVGTGVGSSGGTAETKAGAVALLGDALVAALVLLNLVALRESE